MRPNDMPRPFAPDHSGQHDLAETLRRLFAMSAPTDNAEVANDSPELECVFVNERPAVFFSTLREAADELARLRAEVEGLSAKVAKLKRADSEAANYVESVICMRTHFTGDPPYVGWKGLGLALTEALDERDELRRRIAETQTTRVLAAPGECWVECDVPSDWAGSVVALVRLDAEEGK